jgi:DNA-directed RNA polymerase specialized sigma24 family protein
VALGDLLEGMMKGDREASARLAMLYGPAVRRRIRGKLSPRLRRLFDSEDILSTVLRRLDAYVQTGQMRIEGEPQFMQLLRQISEAAVVDKARVLRRLERVEGADAPLAHVLRTRLLEGENCPESHDETLQAAFKALDDETDRRILWHWLSGRDHAATAESVGLTHAAVRKRWERIRVRLREALERSAA